jgi:glycosyltransferase involved in cell wall biosynthesis
VRLAHDEAPEVRLVITGSGSHVPKLLELIEALDAKDFISFLGFVSTQELFDVLASADVGVVSMRRSGYSDLVHTNKMYDFMSISKPVIATRLRAVEAYFDSSAIAFVEPDDPRGMADAILDLYRHPGKRAALAAEASELYSRYGWPEQRRLYMDAFADLLDENVRLDV